MRAHLHPRLVPTLILLCGVLAILTVQLDWLAPLYALLALLLPGALLLLQIPSAPVTANDSLPANHAPQVIAPLEEDLTQLCEQTLPLWSQQIESARSHTEEAISALSERFSNLAGRIQQSLGNSSEREAGNRLVGLLSTSQHELDLIIMALREALASKETLLQEVMQLANFTEQLQAMANEVAEIAKQTNLLALNAAIEAARAGEQGRGFAVVADEVRQLAQKTQDSTVSIQQMISNLQSGSDRAASSMQETLDKAQASAGNVVKAGELLVQIADGIASISDRNIQVASAAEEQSLVSEEINRNVNDINDLVIQVSAAAEQTAVTSRELASLADHQQQLVGRFKVS